MDLSLWLHLTILCCHYFTSRMRNPLSWAAVMRDHGSHLSGWLPSKLLRLQIEDKNCQVIPTTVEFNIYHSPSQCHHQIFIGWRLTLSKKKKKNTKVTTWAFQTLIKCNPSSSLLDRKNQKWWQTFAAASLSLKICISA